MAIGLDKTGSSCRVDFYFPKLAEVADENAKASEGDSFRVTADSYYEAWKTYEADSENSLDYNHLKVLVLGMDFLEDEKMLGDFLKFSMSQETFARNTLVFVASPDASEVLALNDGLDTPIGTFLEEMAANSNDYKTSAFPTLGDLYNEYYNRDELLFLPVLNDNGGVPVISEYYLLKDFKPAGTLEQQISLEGMLVQNKLKEFSIKPNNDDVIKLTSPRCSYEITEADGNPLVTVTVKSEAVLMNRNYESSEERSRMQQEVNELLGQMLLETLQGVQREGGTDLTESYGKLGGYDRELYMDYADKKEIYDRRVNYVVKTDITLVDINGMQ